MTTAPTAPPISAEKLALYTFLQAQRDSVAAIVDGLDADLAATSVVPSDWTPTNLVEHLAGAERFWVHYVLAGRSLTRKPHHGNASTLADAVAFYRATAATTDDIVAGLDLDARPEGLTQPGLPAELHDVREVLLHLIEETARHAGHLDIARELLDGRTGLGPR